MKPDLDLYEIMEIQKNRKSLSRPEKELEVKELLALIDDLQNILSRMKLSLEEQFKIGTILSFRASDRVKALIKANPKLGLKPLNMGLLKDLLEEDARRKSLSIR